MPTVMVIGDVGGCAAQLAEAVAPVADDPDTVIVQVGDLVDRGPDSAAVLAFVRRWLEDSPDRWIQLVGNHEAQYLGGGQFWPERLDPPEAAVLHTWWLKDLLRVAAAVRTADGEELLITHAGLTVDAWRELGGPVTASTAADLLNTRPEELLWHDRGPLWAEASAHVYRSWLESAQPPPFGQVHGHSSIVDFGRRSWLCGERIRSRSIVDWEGRHTYTRVSGSRFIGVDPRHGPRGAPRWAPLVLHGARLLASMPHG